MANGLLALQNLIVDRDVGARLQAEQPLARQGRERAGKPARTAPSRKGAYFGFGPAR